MKREIIYIGADHAGFSLEDKINKYFDKANINYTDIGGNGKQEDDYPDFAFKVAKSVARNKDSKGILICGTGTGMVIAANKVKGIRAAVAYDSYSAKMAKKHNDVNVLCLRGRKFNDKKNLKLIKIWLKERFDGKKRHRLRLKKIESFERKS